jgi:hypothetical protein
MIAWDLVLESIFEYLTRERFFVLSDKKNIVSPKADFIN